VIYPFAGNLLGKLIFHFGNIIIFS
jgi:hypothetical protein